MNLRDKHSPDPHLSYDPNSSKNVCEILLIAQKSRSTKYSPSDHWLLALTYLSSGCEKLTERFSMLYYW